MTGGFIAPVKWMTKLVAPPYTCAWCHVGEGQSREAFLDTGLTFDFEGTVYLCDACAKSVRDGAGWLTAEEFEESTENLRKEIRALEAQVADYEIIKSFLKDYGLDPVGLKRLKLAPQAAKEELRGRLNLGSGNPDAVSTDLGLNLGKLKVDEPAPRTTGDALTSDFLGLFGN